MGLDYSRYQGIFLMKETFEEIMARKKKNSKPSYLTENATQPQIIAILWFIA